jgi:AraC-like DNA-binding protein
VTDAQRPPAGAERSIGTGAPTAAPERARWPRLAAAPQPRLRSLLSRGYVGFTEATTPRHPAVPATLSVSLVVKLVDSAHRPPAFVMGPHDSARVLEGDCAPSYLEVLLAPLGAYTLLGRPMDELSGQTVDLVDVLGPDGRRLAEQLRETPSWRGRFTLLDQFLLRRLADGPRPAPEVASARERLLATGGAVPIGQLADEAGWSHRHLIARFRQQVGVRPKTAARLVRFDQVWQRLGQAGGRLDWGLVAAEVGYADHAHLVRDFRQFTGTTPTGFRGQLRPPDGDASPKVNSIQAAVAASPSLAKPGNGDGRSRRRL